MDLRAWTHADTSTASRLFPAPERRCVTAGRGRSRSPAGRQQVLVHRRVAGLLNRPLSFRLFAFASEARETTVSVRARSEAARGADSSFTLAVGHIINGYDHLLFLLVLTLRGGGLWSLLKIITAFTVAHSITLAFAVFDLAVLPGRLVETVIALSIARIAAENLFQKYAILRRWFLSAVFGLVHGFGFFPVLADIGLPKEKLALSLLNVNLGIEAGRAIVVLLIVPVLMRLRDRAWESRLVAMLSAVVLAVGLLLFIENALFGG